MKSHLLPPKRNGSVEPYFYNYHPPLLCYRYSTIIVGELPTYTTCDLHEGGLIVTVSLRKIDESNYLSCFNLELASGQERFVSHPIRSLAQAYVYYHQCTPFGIYESDTLVGYVMIIYDYDEEKYNIWHMMIDKAHQGKGYGKAALALVLDYIAGKPFGASNTVLLTVNPQQVKAYALYQKLGFVATGKSDGDEIELQKILKQD
jgi:diamine N-acetyltransferase